VIGNRKSPITNHKSLIAGALLAAALLLAYVPDLGHGFVKDDFGWIRGARIESANDAAALLTRNNGFYRPLVSATFALNYAVSGMGPLAYGVTNFALLLACAALLFMVARRLSLPATPSALAAALWAFNFHGINMAVLWVSGRTALLLSCAALASTLAVLNGRMMLGGVFCLLAMLSKEEAVVLPFLLASWTAMRSQTQILHSLRSRIAVLGARSAPSRYSQPAKGEAPQPKGYQGRALGWLYPARRLSSMWPLLAALAIYFVLRLQSGAFWPATAPSYYRLTIQPSILFRNALEYLDRGATWPVAVALLVAIAARTRPILAPDERRILALGALWFAFGYAITVSVPVRSSLYAVFPSIGACIAVAAVVAALIRQQPSRTLRALAVASVIPLLLVPVYRARNVRLVAPADLSATVLRDVERAATPFPAGVHLVLIDDPAARFTLDAAFGGLLPDALALTLGDQFEGEILAAGDVSNAPRDGTLVLGLHNGRLESRR
jgi:hypothetical protein